MFFNTGRPSDIHLVEREDIGMTRVLDAENEPIVRYNTWIMGVAARSRTAFENCELRSMVAVFAIIAELNSSVYVRFF